MMTPVDAIPADRRVARGPLRWTRTKTVLALVGVLLLLLDQGTKVVAARMLAESPPLRFFGGWLQLTYAENSGAFLSWGADFSEEWRFLIMVVANALVLAVITVGLVRSVSSSAFLQGSWGLVLIGGVGNLIDRLVHSGRVIDFLYLDSGIAHTGVFNLADLYLTVGISLLLIHSFWPTTDRPADSAVPEPVATDEEQSSKTIRPGSLAGLIGGALILWTVTPAAADSVIYRAGQRGGHVALSGEILDYNARQMIFRVKSPDTVHHLGTDQIVSFDAYYSASHKQALEALQQNQFAEVANRAEDALKVETRGWVRRELLALQIQAAINREQWSAAAIIYAALLKSDPQTRHRDLIPLAWQPLELSPEDRAFALRELRSEQPELRLISASWLLDSGESRAAAEAVLTELLYLPQADFRELARCQLWRVRLAAADFNDGDLARWERQLLELPEPLRAGPMFVLAAGWERQIQPEQAAAAYLWIPLMDARNVRLAAAAQNRAAELLKSVGQEAAATRLKNEAAQRFGQPDPPGDGG